MRSPRTHLPVLALLLAAALLLLAAPAGAAPSQKKAIWGPAKVAGKSQFPIYRDLGVGIYQTAVFWNSVRKRPKHPRNPADPAYRWPRAVDFAIKQGGRRGIATSVLLTAAPRWANGNHSSHWAPERPKDFADFAVAAARRYPKVRHWMIWGEPSKVSRFEPLVPAEGRRLSRRQRQGPRLYARMLDASYAALKSVDRRNIVIGGNTWTGGDVTPLNFIKAMRLPNGNRPRMDLYGHNPFTARRPDLGNDPLRYGFADFSDLDTLATWLDRHGYRTARGRRLRLFLSEFGIPTDHLNFEFNFFVDRATQASWLEDALRITRRNRRIYTLGYHALYDDPPRPDGLEVNRGLIDRSGTRKPAYDVFRKG